MAKTESVTYQLNKILTAYDKQVQDATDASIQTVAREAVSKLKNTSPHKTGSYAKGWAAKRERERNGLHSVTVHNKTDYQLTHLLENGHVIRNKYGEYGRTRPIKHIKPVEEWANSELVEEIERRLE